MAARDVQVTYVVSGVGGERMAWETEGGGIGVLPSPGDMINVAGARNLVHDR